MRLKPSAPGADYRPLVPAEQDDESWEEKVGLPTMEGTWRRNLKDEKSGQLLSEYHLEEGHERNRSDPPYIVWMGTGPHVHIPIPADVPKHHIKLFKHHQYWYVERFHPDYPVYVNGKALQVGVWMRLNRRDSLAALPLPTLLSWEFDYDPEDNWYLDIDPEKEDHDPRRPPWRIEDIDGEEYIGEYPCMHPYKHQFPPTRYPEPPEELKRLAWKTDQMRKRSEEDQLRVSDWVTFSKHVKQHYRHFGFTAKPFKDRVCPPGGEPPERPARPLPAWIAQVLSKERQLAGVKAPLAFAEELMLSGLEVTSAPELQRRSGKGKGKGRRKPDADLDTDIDKWLLSMDEDGGLLMYEPAIVERFNTLRELHEEMVNAEGTINRDFFVCTAVRKLGHKRTFEQWFRDRAQRVQQLQQTA